METDAPGSSLSKRNYILLTIALFLSMAAMGLADNVKGPALPRIQDEFTLTELHLGIMLAANGIGYLTACLYTAALANKIGMKACLVISLAIVTGAGVSVSLSPGFAALLISLFFLNLSFGMMDISISVLGARIFTKKTGTMLNLMHLCYGAGAIVSPVISARIMVTYYGDMILGWRNAYLILLSFAIIPVIPAILGRMNKQDKGEKSKGYAKLLRRPTLWFVTLAIAFGTACEVGVTSWLAIFLEKAYSFTAEQAAVRLTLYFVCFTVARLGFGPLIDKFGLINSLIFFSGASGVLIATGVLIGVSGTPILILAGLMTAPIFPTAIAVTAKLFADEVDKAMTVMLTVFGIFLAPAHFTVGGIINYVRTLMTGYSGEVEARIAYSAGYLLIGLFGFISFAATLFLRMKQKKAGTLV